MKAGGTAAAVLLLASAVAVAAIALPGSGTKPPQPSGGDRGPAVHAAPARG